MEKEANVKNELPENLKELYCMYEIRFIKYVTFLPFYGPSHTAQGQHKAVT